MLSKISARIVPMLLLFVSAVFATAPGWVAKGVVLDYSMDGDTVTFTVTERDSDEIRMEIKTGGKYQATENASLDFGQFWFDSSKLKSAKKGDEIGDFKVTGVDTQTIAGKNWDCVTLEASLSGAKTIRIYDKNTGLMLKQTVQDGDAPPVTLKKYFIPDFSAPAPQSAPLPAGPTEEPDAQTETATPEPAASTSGEQAEDAPAATDDSPEKSGDACASGFVLLLLSGFVVARR